MDPAAYLDALAKQLTHELRPNAALKDVFTGNPDLIGKYAEESVRALVRRTVAPLRVSTGAVIDVATVGDRRLPQIDTIVWTPCPAPALFEVGHFGLIPRGSSMGVLEVKRSNYTASAEALAERLTPEFVASVVAAPDESKPLPALGVICILERRNDPCLDRLLEAGSVVALFDREGDEIRDRPRDLWKLINFLSYLRSRARDNEGQWSVTYPGEYLLR